MGCGCGGGNTVVRYEVKGLDGTTHGPYATRGEAVTKQGTLGPGAVVKTITSRNAGK